MYLVVYERCCDFRTFLSVGLSDNNSNNVRKKSIERKYMNLNFTTVIKNKEGTKQAEVSSVAKYGVFNSFCII